MRICAEGLGLKMCAVFGEAVTVMKDLHGWICRDDVEMML